MLKRLLAGLARDTTPEPAEPSADVLLVDDDPSLSALLKVSLKGQDYRVTTAANGREGVEAAWRERPDLIVLDGNMPEMDGFEALKRLRRDRRTARTPVIMLTMRVREGDVLAGFKAGVQEYLTKPVLVGELIDSVSEQLRRSRRTTLAYA